MASEQTRMPALAQRHHIDRHLPVNGGPVKAEIAQP